MVLRNIFIILAFTQIFKIKLLYNIHFAQWTRYFHQVYLFAEPLSSKGTKRARVSLTNFYRPTSLHKK